MFLDYQQFLDRPLIQRDLDCQVPLDFLECPCRPRVPDLLVVLHFLALLADQKLLLLL